MVSTVVLKPEFDSYPVTVYLITPSHAATITIKLSKT